MANMILEERDQQFVLYEMLEAEKLCLSERYADFSKDTFDMILDEARKLAINELFPALVEGDRQGCRLEQGQVHAPACFHRPWKFYGEGGWIAMTNSPEAGGQGLPQVIHAAAWDWFLHNYPCFMYPGLTEGAAILVEEFGTRAQKDRYLGPMLAGKWGGTMSITEPGSGTDVGSLTTKAVPRADGSYRIKGTKIFITAGDHDLAENIIQPVLARVEGDPAGTKGLSLFIVPKYLVNDDGSLGRRNDYSVGGIEEKLGLHGSATCLLNFGDNDDCYAELLGERGQGMKIMFRMMNGARISVGMQGLTVSSMAYLHALKYAKERIQGSSLMNMQNPEAPRVAIIEHPDVRRMLMWMKTQVDSMRALMYYATHCQDLASIATTDEERIKWDGAFEILTPICKAYISDMAFRVCETAVQVHGGYGYTCDYPVEQFLRDSKIGSIYEGANGIQALDLLFRKLNMKKGAVFVHLLSQMNATANRFTDNALVGDLSQDVRAAAGVLAEIAAFFGKSATEGRFLVPVANAYPFLVMMGRIVAGWLLHWEAGVAAEKLEAIYAKKKVNRDDRASRDALVKDDRDVAFYEGKLSGARYYIRNVLPDIDGLARAIKSGDLSIVEMADDSFAV
jgi:alkylation response protein AidB-like acyl-CoA dehydrogenase